ncbi:MAG: M20/M25/M40 family metallo-hydrolase [Verrucomicrobiota bacterium]
MNKERLIAYLEGKLPEYLELLRQMVLMNSWTQNIAGVNRLGEFTAEVFGKLGFTAEYVQSKNPKYGKHLILTRPGKGAKSVAMVSHLDTVFPPEEEERNDFKWRVEGDFIYGPGTNDIKGGTVMMWLMLVALRDLEPELFESVTWKLFLNSSEEEYSPDFGHVCTERFAPNTLGALVFESEGRLGEQRLVVTSRKGRATWRVTSSGRGSHAGSKHSHGANAIVQIGKTVQQIAPMTDYSRELTVNVATIEGGTVMNRVPHEAVAEGEFRSFDPQVFEEAKQAILKLNGPGEVHSPVDRFACELKAVIKTVSRPWPRNEGSERLCQIWEAAGAELGMLVGHQERGGLSDGNLIWDAVPTLDGLGPWGDNSHCSERSADGSKEQEYIEVPSIVPKAAWNLMGLQKLIANS